MKITSTATSYQSTIPSTGKKMGFAPEAQSFLMDMMSDGLYSDKFGSIVREIASNCIDANTESGSTEPIRIKVTKPNSFANQGEISFSDNGIGISPQRIDDIFTLYFASTKRDGNEMIGGFGIGAKSPFAYTDVFRVVTRFEGTEYTYLMEKKGNDRTCTLLTEGDYEGDSGTTILIPIKDGYDYEKFVDAINRQTVLMRPISVELSTGEFQPANVYEYENFYIVRQRGGNELENKVALGNVIYDCKELGSIIGLKSSYYSINIIPKMEIGSVMPTMSRESLQFTEEAKENIDRQMALALGELQGIINSRAEETDNPWEFVKSSKERRFKVDDDYNVSLYWATNENLLSIKALTYKGIEGLSPSDTESYLRQLLDVKCELSSGWRGTKFTYKTKNPDEWRAFEHLLSIRSRYSTEDVVLIRMNRGTKFTAAAKDFQFEKGLNSGKKYFFVTRSDDFHSPATLQSYAKQLGYKNVTPGSVNKEKVIDFLYENIGKQALVSLMSMSESEKDWFPTEEWIEARKERMKQERKAAKVVKPKADGVYRFRGLGEFGVVEDTPDNLFKHIKNSYLGSRYQEQVVYLTTKQVETIKAERDAKSRYTDLDEFIKSKYEIGGVRLFAVSEATAKVLRAADKFVDFDTYTAKKNQRTAEHQDFYNCLSYLFHESDVFAGQSTSAMKDIAYNTGILNKDEVSRLYALQQRMYKRGFRFKCENLGDDDNGFTKFDLPENKVYTYMNKTYNLTPLFRLQAKYEKGYVNQPFLYEAIAEVRNWNDNYKAKLAEISNYVFPNRQK